MGPCATILAAAGLRPPFAGAYHDGLPAALRRHDMAGTQGFGADSEPPWAQPCWPLWLVATNRRWHQNAYQRGYRSARRRSGCAFSGSGGFGRAGVAHVFGFAVWEEYGGGGFRRGLVVFLRS